MSLIAKKFSANLRRIRRAKGLTLRQIADAIGKTEGAVSYWESARSLPSGANIDKLVTFLEIPSELLFIRPDFALPEFIYAKDGPEISIEAAIKVLNKNKAKWKIQPRKAKSAANPT